MNPPAHAGVSLVVGGVVWAATRSPGSVLAALAAGVLIDLDHLPDYFNALVLRRRARVWLLLHSYEWVVPGLLAAYLSGWNPMAVAGVGAFLAHILCDQVGNQVYPFSYFFTYRLLKGFRAEEVAGWSGQGMERTLMAYPATRLLTPWVLRTLRRWLRTEHIETV